MSDMTPEEQLANTMDLIANLANTFIAGAASYREQCIAAGFNETAAEQMALAMHQALVARALMDIGGAS